MLTVDDIARLFADRGHEQYSGEPVTQLEHALQTAALAEAEERTTLVTSSLLHDLGHLLHDLGETPTLRGVDDVHQYRALPHSCVACSKTRCWMASSCMWMPSVTSAPPTVVITQRSLKTQAQSRPPGRCFQ